MVSLACVLQAAEFRLHPSPLLGINLSPFDYHSIAVLFVCVVMFISYALHFGFMALEAFKDINLHGNMVFAKRFFSMNF